MAKERKQYPDDDGRTIADMSGIERQPLFLPRFKKRSSPSEQSEETEEKMPFSGKERRSFIFGALSAALMIAGVFVAVFAIVIALMVLFWR